LHTGSLLGLFSLFKSPFINLSKKEAVAAAFAASHKTLAFGLPLVKTVFEGTYKVFLFCQKLILQTISKTTFSFSPFLFYQAIRT